MNRKTIFILLGIVAVGAGTFAAVKFLPLSSQAAHCSDHQIEMANCPFCNKKLVEEMGWCNGHDIEEAYCTLCNPRFIPAFKKVGDWCEEHQIPESQCKICKHSLQDQDPDGSHGAEETGAEFSEAGGIQLVLNESTPRYQRKPSVTCKTNELRVRFLSEEIAAKAGLEYTVVQERPVTATLTCNAEVEFDGQHYARIASRVGGVVSEVKKDLGDAVVAGDVLAVVDSIELANAQGEFLRTRALFELADKNHDRVHTLVEKGIATEQDDLEAEAKLEERRVVLSQARQRLMNLGLAPAQIEDIARTGETASRLSVTAPFDGVIVERSAVMGEVVDTTRHLFALADTSKMWAMLDVYEVDLFKVRIGQSVIFAVEGLPGEQFGGKITWISSHVDHRTRTLKARAEIDNPDGLLRANMFGRALVAIHDESPLVVVPKSAVQWEGCCNVVFKKISDLVFAPEKVRLGIATEDYYEVLEGVEPNEVLVTQGSFLLKTEILKGSIGAGCCEVDHLGQ